MLTLDGTAMPSMGGYNTGMGTGAGLGVGGGVLGGLLAGGLAGAVLGGRGGLGGWGGNGYGAAPAAAAVATDIVLNPAFQSLQNQVEQLGDQLGTNSILAGITSVNQNVSGTTRDTLNSIANLSTAQAAANFTTLQSINGLGRDVTAQANQNALQQLNSFNNLTTTTLQGFNGGAMQVQNVTNQIVGQLQAMAATQAACCCELKSLIQSDGNITRALINANTMQDLRDRNVELAGEVSNFRQTQAILRGVRDSSEVIV